MNDSECCYAQYICIKLQMKAKEELRCAAVMLPCLNKLRRKNCRKLHTVGNVICQVVNYLYYSKSTRTCHCLTASLFHPLHPSEEILTALVFKAVQTYLKDVLH